MRHEYEKSRDKNRRYEGEQNCEKNQNLDSILKTALTLDIEPDQELNQYILGKWKENVSMKKGGKRRLTIAAAAACMILATGSVLAAARYMKMAELAERSGIETMKSVFSGEDVLEINETKEAGEYRFTLLGIASGEKWGQSDLSEQLPDLKGTYAAVAVERLDGTPMPSTSEDAYSEINFFISPLIAGLKPWQYNIASMNGGYTDLVQDGIFYRLIECDDVIPFADRDLYLCISNTTFFDSSAYQYEESSGKISRNEEYSGINLLFSLPIDASKADPAAADVYLKELEASWNSSAEESMEDEEDRELIENLDNLLANKQDGEALEGFAAVGDPVVITQEDGKYCYSYSDEEESAEVYFYQTDFQDGRDYMIFYTGGDDETTSWKKISIVIVTENQDGTATAQRYERTIG